MGKKLKKKKKIIRIVLKEIEFSLGEEKSFQIVAGNATGARKLINCSKYCLNNTKIIITF